MRLICGDFLEIIEELIIEGVKFDAVITDIPYGVTANPKDIIIPYDLMWEKLKKVTKPTSPIILFGQQPFSSSLVLSNLKMYKYSKYWLKDRPSGFLNAKRQPLRNIEEIMFFYKKQCLYNPIMVEGEPSHSIGKAVNEKHCANNSNYGNFGRVNSEGNLKYPRQIMEYKRPHPPVHRTQKPVELMKDLLLTYTKKGDLVLDFTMGSGTTGVACVQTERDFIGIEIDTEYFNIAKERIYLKKE